MPETYTRNALLILVCAAIALPTGMLFGAAFGWGILAAGFLLLLLHHIAHLERLRRWAAGSLHAQVPEGRGTWSAVFDLLYRRQRNESQRRMRLGRVLARSRQAGRALPYGLAILDSDYHIVWCNDSAESHLGIRLDRDRGQTITHLVRQPEFFAHLAARDLGKPLELKPAGANGPLLSVQFVPYAESQWLLLSRDITQYARVERIRRDFVANISHELRTPLTVLVGFMETILELKLDPERSRDYLNMMADQGKRMQRIIDDLLVLSTLESTPEPRSEERIDMMLLLARLRTDAEALSAGRHRIAVEVVPAGPHTVLGSESELASAFGNLVSNAVRYTPAGGEIRITWRKLSDGAEFAVEDTGPGIAPEHIPRLTERFYRVDRGRSRDTGGTGLGLAIVKHALARHQAELDIQSEIGRGSRFAARFPARRVPAPPTASVHP
jgi:two-component system phosphate regulon sensor histidine kinase PhoR